jgi:hypothetical protein
MCKMISHDGEGHIIMTGQKCGGLWRLHISTVNQPSAANVVATTSICHPGVSKPNLTLQRWHARLGHVSVSTLKKMSSQDLVLGLPSFESTTSYVCSGCAYGKSHRTPFPVNAERKRMHKPGLFFHADSLTVVITLLLHIKMITAVIDSCFFSKTGRIFCPRFRLCISRPRKKPVGQ